MLKIKVIAIKKIGLVSLVWVGLYRDLNYFRRVLVVRSNAYAILPKLDYASSV